MVVRNPSCSSDPAPAPPTICEVQHVDLDWDAGDWWYHQGRRVVVTVSILDATVMSEGASVRIPQLVVCTHVTVRDGEIRVAEMSARVDGTDDEHEVAWALASHIMRSIAVRPALVATERGLRAFLLGDADLEDHLAASPPWLKVLVASEDYEIGNRLGQAESPFAGELGPRDVPGLGSLTIGYMRILGDPGLTESDGKLELHLDGVVAAFGPYRLPRRPSYRMGPLVVRFAVREGKPTPQDDVQIAYTPIHRTWEEAVVEQRVLRGLRHGLAARAHRFCSAQEGGLRALLGLPNLYVRHVESSADSALWARQFANDDVAGTVQTN